MDRCCFFIKDKALFGSYPSNESVKELEKNGVKYFIDLTTIKDNVKKYNTLNTIIKYPILDHNPPNDWSTFTVLLYKIKNIIINLQGSDKIYIHCRGGHGRSATLAACLLVYMYNISSSESLKLINSYHSIRKNMSDKSRNSESPNKIPQIIFVYKYFSPLFFNSIITSNTYKSHNNKILSFALNSNHNIRIDNMFFRTSSDAIYYFTKYNNTNMDNNLIIENIIRTKLLQHNDILDLLYKTGMRPIINLYVLNNKMNNIVGEIYMKIRKDLII